MKEIRSISLFRPTIAVEVRILRPTALRGQVLLDRWRASHASCPGNRRGRAAGGNQRAHRLCSNQIYPLWHDQHHRDDKEVVRINHGNADSEGTLET